MSEANATLMSDARTEATDFAFEVVTLVTESDLHRLATFAALLSAIANSLVDVECDSAVVAVRTLAKDIERRAIT